VETPVVAEEASAPAAKTATAAPVAEEKATSKKYVAPPKQEGEIAIPSLVLPDDTWGEDEDDDIGDGTGYSKVQRAKYESIYESTLKELNENEIVSGIIVSIGDKEVVLNIGFKSEGVVPINEFRDLDKVKIGDSVEVYLESVEDQDGQLVLSRKRAKHMRTWARVMKAEEEDVILEGLIRAAFRKYWRSRALSTPSAAAQ
jgi:small subunit ribosomal protein S1